MITYRKQVGARPCETMTVGELREKLLEYDNDTPVFATWEGVLAPVDPVDFRLEDCHYLPNQKCLVIDVEYY